MNRLGWIIFPAPLSRACSATCGCASNNKVKLSRSFCPHRQRVAQTKNGKTSRRAYSNYNRLMLLLMVTWLTGAIIRCPKQFKVTISCQGRQTALKAGNPDLLSQGYGAGQSMLGVFLGRCRVSLHHRPCPRLSSFCWLPSVITMVISW